MKLFAGTSKGLFEIQRGRPHCLLKVKGVREVVQLGNELFAELLRAFISALIKAPVGKGLI